MKKLYLVVGLCLIGARFAHADNYPWGRTYNGAGITTNEATLSVSSTAVAGGAVTMTLVAPTGVTNIGGTGYFIYLTGFHLEMYATGTLTGGATPVTCTTTNIPGNPVFKFPTAAATGTIMFNNTDYAFPLRASAANTAVTVVCPATTNVIWNLQANSYIDN